MKKTFAAILGATMMTAPMAFADDWPTRPLTMVIGFNPGGSTDIQGRVLANVMEEFLGQPVNVVNQPGGGSAVAFTRLANTEADGYTFLFGGTTALTFTPIITPVEYEIDDFEYLAAVAIGQNAIVTSADQPFSTFDEIIAYGKENQMTYAQQTPLDEAIISAIAEEEGLDLAIVPTGGGGGMAPLVLGKEVDFAYSGGTHAQYTPTGEMVVAAFMSAERSPFYPEVPTLMELGYDYSIEDYRTIIVPTGTPDNVKERLMAAAEYASESDAFKEITEGNTFFPVVYIGQEEMEANVRRIRAATEEVMAD
ncbi:Bug family tripartite tricarboxylate transporter substrate binding protein [Roseinatronobacter bogoriensis]|uniref:Tripartite tricarboxylate transporter substrate binding protein n=1 Tax=Roseinatronobacter bogoriensis subsp. barguzinensis TaxID=441209 RepID=A0A2K8KJ87_9RHOB|nr:MULTISPECIES: tripartite tricarboxylate transporter substrate binding protein [Rhodobaca]ATX66948.1 tripartite tricarboxylate transporter substrate binding protein [Rhodobaca barguzinensis]MBB4206439.1 tripartite-type tricarboxylate transporter receptor subunit TctC [Rhodobaca bogoriensis DSM 18756]TDW41183.1 tripartite-type tricarboxylate transporter receptor subunit TctC [Rhodobaca barguzinensis]TDY74639.1 tripartite-type tricarboxylate transporter receptor subunit TctC [Rhodobaca bogorien